MAERTAPADRNDIDAKLCGFVTMAYLLGARGAQLRRGLPGDRELPTAVASLLRGLGAAGRPQRARALAPQIALLTQALRARSLRRWIEASGPAAR